jgi:hypothetical protein
VPATPLATTDDLFGLQVRSGEHGAALVSGPCPRHAGAGLHLPCWPDRKPLPHLGCLADRCVRGAREHAFSASSSASTDHGKADGDPCASRASQAAWRCLPQGRVTRHRRSRRPDTIAQATGSAGCSKTGVRNRAERTKARALMAAAEGAVRHCAPTNETKARVTPGSICARRNCADGWLPERNTGGAERLPLFHPLSYASDVSAYAARRRLAARLFLARRGFFRPVRG